MFKNYGELSTMLYEHTKPPGQSVGGDIEFYCEKLTGVQGPVLEAGVGTGRMLVPLLQKGFTVDGVDISPEMLAKCKENLAKHGMSADLYEQDLTKLSLPRKYAAIIMPTGSFCLLSREIIPGTLASLYNHLEAGGKFIADIIFPDDFKQGETFSQTYPMDGGTGILYTNFHRDINWPLQKTSHIIKYELVKDGAVQKTEVSDFTLHWYGIWEMEMLLKAAGFTDIRQEVGYGVPGQASPITFTASKQS